ncbi:MAG TPA: leucyl/phenylalanyl-tRNA--protein transferase [Acidimicrobiales bacterium]|nr:leucyl/phenylalanyl-tRNA--protein transferase [Acidimicrobiales bacterium]
MPIEPAPSAWRFPRPGSARDRHRRVGGSGLADDVVAVGADLEPGTLLAGYRNGLFPMPLDLPGRPPVMGWWSPDPRAILPVDGLRVSRSLARSCRRFEVRVNTAFEAVGRACASPDRPGRWITPDISVAYEGLHHLGWAHSVEAWAPGEGPGGEDLLAGGLYGVAIGGFFAGESMFHRRSDASKVALVALVEHLVSGGATLLDVQWLTPHLGRLGAVEISRERYLDLLAEATARPLPSAFGGP